MSHLSSVSRVCFLVAVAVIATLSSHTAAAAMEADVIAGERLAPAPPLLSPFACGTEWRGSTYSGHGSNNWNLDLNRAGDHGSDLGQPVAAQGDGTVVWFKPTGYNNRAGTYIEIDYGDITARYLHLVSGSIPDEVAEIGAEVTVGQPIGLVGATGRASGPHLHLEYWNSAEFVDMPSYDLPRGNHLPVAFDGEPLIATPGQKTEVNRSTNCSGAGLDDKRVAIWIRRFSLNGLARAGG